MQSGYGRDLWPSSCSNAIQVNPFESKTAELLFKTGNFFRTEKEAIAIANNTMYGLGASVHSEKLPLALETAKHIKAGTVWINCHNLFDAAAGFGGYKQSGFGRDGGQEGLYEYVKPKWMPKV